MIAGTPGRPPKDEGERKYQVIPVLAAAVRNGATVHGQVIRYDWQDKAWYPQPGSGALCGVQRLTTAGQRERITCAGCLRRAERYWTDYENYLAPGEERKGR